MRDGKTSAGVRGEDPAGNDALEGSFSLTPCAEQVEYLQGLVREQKETIRRLSKKVARCYSSQSRLRTESELAIRDAVAKASEASGGLGGTVVKNAPPYEDADDESTT